MNYVTIPGFVKLSRQEIFDISAKHILSTKTKSVDGGTCMYSGTGCAAAPFILPEHRADCDKQGDATSWSGLVSARLVPRHEAGLVQRLQSCHDSAPSGDAFMAGWRQRMLDLAKYAGLSDQVLR